MKVLVTGGAGYIGSVVAQQLLARGHEVEVLDDLSAGHPDAVLSGARWHHGDLSEAREILDPSFDAVIHLAAKSLVGESVQHPERYWHGNIVASLGLLDTMREAGVRRLVFSSTAAVYGNPLPDLPGGSSPRSIRPLRSTRTGPPSWPSTICSPQRRTPTGWLR